MTAEGPGFPSKDLPHVGYGILMWENEHSLNATSLPASRAFFHSVRIWGDS